MNPDLFTFTLHQQELEIEKLKAANEALRVSNASALGFILKHQIGRSLEGYGVRKLLSETLREAA